MVGKHYPGIEAAEEQGAYSDQFDAITFNEGVVHLVFYRQQEIETVSWDGSELNEIHIRWAEKIRSALREQDPQKQKQSVYEANFGAYYSKYVCMCGMLSLGRQWQKGGLCVLIRLFDQGNHGFA